MLGLRRLLLLLLRLRRLLLLLLLLLRLWRLRLNGLLGLRYLLLLLRLRLLLLLLELRLLLLLLLLHLLRQLLLLHLGCTRVWRPRRAEVVLVVLLRGVGQGCSSRELLNLLRRELHTRVLCLLLGLEQLSSLGRLNDLCGLRLLQTLQLSVLKLGLIQLRSHALASGKNLLLLQEELRVLQELCLELLLLQLRLLCLLLLLELRVKHLLACLLLGKLRKLLGGELCNLLRR